MNELKWTNGEPCERSSRFMRPPSEPIIPKEIIDNAAFMQALTCDEPETIHFAPLYRSENKRENMHNRMAERELISQIGRNPFLDDKESNYIVAQNTFMKPIATKFEQNKETNID